jgi:uncharacterized protein YukE
MYGRFALEWDLVGGDPTPGDPTTYSTLSGFFEGTAQSASEAGCRLRALALNADDSVWRGQAADAFREDLGELPKKLDQLHNSYHEASEALRIYGVSLRQLQSKADTELQKAVTADEEIRRQVDALMNSMSGTGFVAPAPVGVGPGPSGPTPFGLGLDGATNGSGNDPTEDARSRLAAARAAVEQIRQERETEEGKCVAKLDHAHDIGMHNKGLLDKIGGWVGDRIDDLADIHHKMLRAIADIADRIAEALTIVAIALVVVAAVALVAGAVVASGGTASLALTWLMASAWSAAGSTFVAAGWAKLVGVRAKLESKALYHDPDIAWSQLVKDGALAGLTVVGGPVKAAKYVRESRAFLRTASAIETAALRGNRVAQYTFESGEFTGKAWGNWQTFRKGLFEAKKTLDPAVDGIRGSTPNIFGMGDKVWRKGEKVWQKRKDDPLGIFTDPIKTSPGHVKKPDGTGVWIKDFGRSILEI